MLVVMLGEDRQTNYSRKKLFIYFYVCFDALNRGWLEGCRKIIWFDGCFLKGACKGELLVAGSRNANQQLFIKKQRTVRVFSSIS